MTLTISICIVNLGFIIDHIDLIEYNSKEKLNNPCIFNFQSYQCHSSQLAKHVQQFGQQWWGLNDMVCSVNDQESDEEEEEDIEEEEDEFVSKLDVYGDEGLEGDEENNELILAQGHEGILLWDSLGEGFLQEASQLGISVSYYFIKGF